MKKQILHSGSFLLMTKQIIPFFLLMLTWGISFGQQDVALNTKATVPVAEVINTDESVNAAAYMVTSTDKKISGEYKDLVIKISPVTVDGKMSLIINSRKNRNVLIELRNSLEDELLFQTVKLTEGDNIISFETDDESVTFFQLKLGAVNSNSIASFLLLKK
jgi:hypothetical protein